MNYLIYFIITIAILVFVHEFGHFIAAKLSKMRVDVFAIGFSKRLLGWNKITGFTFGELPEDFDGQGNTDYRICALPLGGYVKIAGMVDESFDVKFADKEPQPYEFRSKPTYQKLIVITAGVLMNLLLAYVIFASAHYLKKKEIWETTTVGYVQQNSPAQKAGLKENDKILKINGKPVSNWGEVFGTLYIENLGKSMDIQVKRNNDITTLNVPGNTFSTDSKNAVPLEPAGMEVAIDSVLNDSPAHAAGIKSGDIILSMNNVHVGNPQQLVNMVSSNAGKQINVSLLRNKDTVSLAVTPGKDGKIGVYQRQDFTGKIKFESTSLGEALWLGITDIGTTTILTYQLFGRVIQGSVAFSKVFGGPVKIAQYAARTAETGIFNFISFLGMLSLSLAILNILPFPVLDGGHFVMILIEGIMKREIPIKVKVAIQNAGFVILLLFMAFIIYNDIVHL